MKERPIASQLADWHWQSCPLDQRTGSEIFAALFLAEPIATLLESPYPPAPDYPQLARYSICAGAPRRVEDIVQQWTPDLGNVFSTLKDRLARPVGDALDPDSLDCQLDRDAAPHDLPFIGGWLGWLGYDVAAEVESVPLAQADPIGFPVAFWYEPECFAVLDHQAQILWLAGSRAEQLAAMRDRLNTAAGGDRVDVHSSVDDHPVNLHPVDFHTTPAEYAAAIGQAQRYIQAGDIFQANLSLRFSTQTPTSSWAIYQALQQINPSPFASYWKTPWGEIISCSPERLVAGHWQDEKFHVSTRPIAGTRRRGQNDAQNQQLAAELLSNTKEQAEHIMLVDLERNDLGRVCQWGSVVVDELLAIEHYSHVMHLVSNVMGILKPEYDSVDLVRAVFPGGTITGCPKVRCMAIIAELEPVRRSLFYGSCGYFDRRGNLDLNILIRTLLYRRNGDRNGDLATVWGQVGAGIVADSDADHEWSESLQKAQAQLQALRCKA
jgi:para-aminobenzoate synthetase component I